MEQHTYIQQTAQATRKVQALLQQLIANRGQPETAKALQPYAGECLTELFKLSEEAGRHQWPTKALDEAKSTLLKHFPELLEHAGERWTNA